MNTAINTTAHKIKLDGQTFRGGSSKELGIAYYRPVTPRLPMILAAAAASVASILSYR